MCALAKRMRPLLGCFVEIALPKHSPQSAFNVAFEQIELIQNLLSFHNPNSDLSRLNSAQGEAVNCHPLSIYCLRLAQTMTRVSRGHFNCTLGTELIKRKILPEHTFAVCYGETLLNIGNWNDMELTKNTARLRRPVLITLDGIAKGFAIDSAIDKLKRLGIEAGWINAGGDIRVFGDIVLPITVRDHRGNDNYMGGLQNAAIATSTSIASNEFPGMLLDAKGNEIPATTSTIIARKAWRADALTKVAAAIPHETRVKTIADFGGRWVEI